MIDKSKNILFICDYAQSRSKYFAEKFQELGYNTKYRGFCKEADIPINEIILNWSNVVIVLSDSWLHDDEFHNWLKIAESMKKEIRYFHISDEPGKFSEKFQKLLEFEE